MKRSLTMTNRYHIGIRLDKYREHRGVMLTLYHPDSIPKDAYTEMIPPHLNCEDLELRSVAEMSSSEAEVALLRNWCVGWTGATLRVERAPQVEAHECCRWVVGSAQGIIDLSALQRWPLPDRVEAYYDLRHAARGP
jgi:hypothetical protein